MPTQGLDCDQISSDRSTDKIKRPSVRISIDGKVSSKDTFSGSIDTEHATRNKTNLPNKTFAQEDRELIEGHRRRESSISEKETTLTWDDQGMPSFPSMEPTSVGTTENENTDQTHSETVATELADQGVATSPTELEDEQDEHIRDNPVEDEQDTSDDDLEMVKHFKLYDKDYVLDTAQVTVCDNILDFVCLQSNILVQRRLLEVVELPWVRFRDVLWAKLEEIHRFNEQFTAYRQAVVTKKIKFTMTPRDLLDMSSCLLYTSPSPRDRG